MKQEEEIFNGAFWSSKKAKDLGLIDDIVDLDQLIEEKFGKKVKIILINSKKSWIKRRIGIEILAESFVDTLLQKLTYKDTTTLHPI